MKLKIFIFLLLSTILITGCENKNKEAPRQEAKTISTDIELVDNENAKINKMCVEPGEFDAKAFSEKYGIPIDNIDGKIAEQASRGGRFGRPDPRLVLQLVCYGVSLPFDYNSAVEEAYNNWKNGIAKEFNLCDHAISGGAMSVCAYWLDEEDKKNRELMLRELEGKLGKDSSRLLRDAYNSAVKFIEAKVISEEGHDGTAAGAWITSSEIDQKNEYLKLISRIMDGFKPTASSNFDKADQQLRDTFEKTIQQLKVKAGSHRLLPEVEELRENQRLWILYRDASVKLFLIINPSSGDGLWKSWLTETREGQLKEILTLENY